jgi:hypothetical protein
MTKWILVALAGATLAGCATGITVAKGKHATPATVTAWHNPSMPDSSGQKLRGVRSRDTQTSGSPGAGMGAGVN